MAPALCLALAVLQGDPWAARAESSLAAADYAGALRAARLVVERHPTDPRAHLLLGRVHYARPVVGRYAALAEFRVAERLAPADPEPWYWEMTTGFYLGSDEGDGIAREAMLRILALDPDYRSGEVWRRFQTVYHDAGIWRRADTALARHPDDPTALIRRAEIAVYLEEPQRADSLLTAAAARRPPDPAAYLLRAEADFLAGRTAAGYAWHDSAVARADADSTGALWNDTWMIAAPDEIARHATTVPGERRRFFEWFWSRRDPNLVTPENERLPEHYRRLAYARRYFRLLHPQNAYFRSAEVRALAVMAGRGALSDQRAVFPDLRSAGQTLPDARDVGDTGATGISQMAAAGVDARGLVYVRHGPPDTRLAGAWDPLQPMSSAGSPLDNEGWVYETPDGPLSIGFRRGTGDVAGIGPAGDIAFFPVNDRQVESSRRALETDRTALPAPLATRGWTAFFLSGELGNTDVCFRSAPGTAAAVLWNRDAEETVRVAGAGFLVLTVPPGRYTYGLDTDSAGVQGRVRGTLAVPAYTTGDLGLSSLLLAASDSLLDRETAMANMPPDLRFAPRAALASYAEVYGLSPDATGRAHYRVRYTFAPVRALAARMLRGTTPVVFEFARETPVARVVPEQLVIDAGRLAPGRYRVTLAVTDVRRNVKSETVAIEVTVR